MSKPQARIALTMAREWAIRRPYVYRYMPKIHVDEFFTRGRLRLSSFSAFSKHQDEQRLDTQEGRGIVVNTDTQGEGQTLYAVLGQGHDAYVLCGSMRYEAALADAFGADSGFRINDPTSFGCAIANVLPGFRTGLEGPCHYVGRNTVTRAAGKIDFDSMKIDPNRRELDMGKMFSAVFGLAGDDLFFIKNERFGHQAEYRLLWAMSNKIADFIDIECPGAAEFCTPFDDL